MKEEEIRNRVILNRYLELVSEDVKTLFADRSGFIQINCPACESDKYESQFEKLRFTYTQCLDCGTLFVNPRPPSVLLNDFYTRSLSSSFWANEFFPPVAEARREKIFHPRAEHVRDTFPEESGGTIGDIGAGLGLFLEELHKAWPHGKLIAIEPSIEMADTCQQKDLEVIPHSIEDVSGWDGQFDLLTSFELFEHLFNPGGFLKKVRNLLRPGGHLFLTTLNGEGFDIQVLWEKSKSVMPPHHLNFLNPRSIAILLQNNGFAVEKIDTPGKLDWDIVEGMHREDTVDIGHFWKLVAEKAGAEEKSVLQTWISESGFSSHMRIVARKVEDETQV